MAAVTKSGKAPGRKGRSLAEDLKDLFSPAPAAPLWDPEEASGFGQELRHLYDVSADPHSDVNGGRGCTRRACKGLAMGAVLLGRRASRAGPVGPGVLRGVHPRAPCGSRVLWRWQGSSTLGSPLPGRPVSGALYAGRPVSGASYAGRPVSGALYAGRPVSGAWEGVQGRVWRPGGRREEDEEEEEGGGEGGEMGFRTVTSLEVRMTEETRAGGPCCRGHARVWEGQGTSRKSLRPW